MGAGADLPADAPTDGPGETLSARLIAHREVLANFLRRSGGGLLRHETVGDQVQGVHLRALEVAERFEYRGEAEFINWLKQLARQHIADRHRYWGARKRCARNMLRLTAADMSTSDSRTGLQIAASTTSPSGYAVRKERFATAIRAISVLLPRDRQIIDWIAEGKPVAEIAETLGLGLEAAERARRRTIERFLEVYRRLDEGPARRE